MSYDPTSATLAIVQRLGGAWTGRHAMVRCPAHPDRTPSLSIRQGRTSILVHCFAGCDGPDVMRALRRELGGPVADQEPARQVGALREAPYRCIWEDAGPVDGTLAARYLRDVRGITFLPPDVRFHPRCPKGRGRSAQFLPALLVGVFQHGRLIAIQRLFLDPGTARRTDRMMLGNSRGGTWPARFAGDTMAIAEGFETACAYRQVTGREAGTCFGVRNFAHFVVGDGICAVALLPDNDNEGQAFARIACERRLEQGTSASIIACPAGYGDWGNLLEAAPARSNPP